MSQTTARALLCLAIPGVWLVQACASAPALQDGSTAGAQETGGQGGDGVGAAGSGGNNTAGRDGSAAGSGGNNTAGRNGSAAGSGGNNTAGSAPGGGAGGNNPGKEPDTSVQPIERSGRYLLEFEDIIFECDPAAGGRVTAFALDGNNFLTGPEINTENYGSTLWTSPQNDWGWPPPYELDRAPYQATIKDTTIELTGPSSDQLGIRFIKRFSADRLNRAVVLHYLIENTGPVPRSVAPWEVSRVHPNGLTFFPRGEANFGSGTFQPLQSSDAAGATWFQHDPGSISGDQKLFADGSRGWIAHLAGDALFIKAFPDLTVAQQAPGEAEIEIYANQSYVEVEQQGALETLAAGETLSWTVRWYARRLPAGIDATVGSQALLDLVEDTIAAR